MQPVSSSEQLQEQLDLFKHALESGQRAKGSITVVALPNVCGVAEISVVHRLRRSLFSKTLKENRFYLLLTRYVGEELQMYEKVTDTIVKKFPICMIGSAFCTHDKKPSKENHGK